MDSIFKKMQGGTGPKSTTVTLASAGIKDLGELFNLAVAIQEILVEADKITVRVDLGNGMAPATRRVQILRKKSANPHLFAFFLAVHTRRGANWRLYGNQANELQGEYRNAADFFGISLTNGDKGVTSQVIANCFADLMQAYRKDRPLEINSVKVPGSINIDPRYQWVGSLGSMYYDGEDHERTEVIAWLKKTVIYINFMYWYVEETGKLTGREQQKGKKSIAERILKGCHFAWQSWDFDTRQKWASDDFSFSPSSGKVRFAALEPSTIAEIITANKWNN